MKKLIFWLTIVLIFSFKNLYSEENKMILELPYDQREVIEMRLFREMSFKEIAELTNVSINTALGRMRYAIINLRKLVSENQIILSA